MARRGYSLLFATGLILSDCLAIILGYRLAFAFRFQSHEYLFFIPPPLEIPPVEGYTHVLPFVLMVMLLSFRSGGLYRESLSFIKIVRIGSIFKQVFYGVIILIALSALYREVSFSRLFGLLLIPCFTGFVVLGRTLLNKVELQVRKHQGKKIRIILAGEGGSVVKLIKRFRSPDLADYHLLGMLALSGDQAPLPHTTILGTLDEYVNVLDAHQPDEVILSTANLDHSTISEFIAECDRRMIQFYIVPDMFNVLTSRVELTSLGGINLLGLEKFPLDNGLNRAVKRVMDILGSLTGLILCSPLLLLSALAIKLTSRGPLLYTQTRCREDGQNFVMYKFRTMLEGAEHKSGPVFASKTDDRCTSVGRFLRATNIDELPQLFNVLEGHMSLVGPRPERPHFISRFKTDVPRYMSRHHIKPGLTGWAQVNGWRGDTSLDERVKYDLYYIENWSIWFDLKIIFLTFFSYKNAY